MADHTMMMILATYRRLTLEDRMVREGSWGEGRPLLSQFPRLSGQPLGFVAFGRVARAVSVRAKAFGVHMLAYDLRSLSRGADDYALRGGAGGADGVVTALGLAALASPYSMERGTGT